jgi:phage gp36-like protein
VAYTTQAKLESAIGAAAILRLTDDEKAGSIVVARVTAAILVADQEIDAYARKHYSVPIAAPVPAMVEKLSTDLAVYYLFRRRLAELGIPEDVRDLRREALKQLEAINAGKIDLGVEPPPAVSTAEIAQTDGAERLFTTDTMEDF